MFCFSELSDQKQSLCRFWNLTDAPQILENSYISVANQRQVTMDNCQRAGTC